MVGQAAALGLALCALVGFGVGVWLGPAARLAAVVFGLVATGLQTWAVALAERPLALGDYRGLLGRWGAGAGLRLLGVIMIPVAVTIDRTLFPPLPAALGYVAVLVPLLFFEIRRFR